MNNEEAKQLLIKYRAGKCTAAEVNLIEGSFMQYNEHEIDISQERIAEIGKQIYTKLPFPQKTGKSRKLWYNAAAAAILLLSISSWLLFGRSAPQTEQVIVHDVAPGGNRATLTLANGEKINLSNVEDGVVIKANRLTYPDGTAVIKNISEQLQQTLSTPKGGQYQILLADGTKVWLNAASSLTYPVNFKGKKERIVELQGEAFFEVAPNKSHPFLVKTAAQTVEVLGTHFNINSFNDQGSTITTLEEGSVKVTNVGVNGMKKVILKPGQQSLTSKNEIKVQQADLETELAWKNGRIEFKDADLSTIMKQVSRWYDIVIEYQGKVPDRKFNGSISRKSNLSVLLKILAYSDVHFTIAQNPDSTKKLIVKP
ncbi:MAG: FecR domain-containing protein [Bacteroidota bacterium]